MRGDKSPEPLSALGTDMIAHARTLAVLLTIAVASSGTVLGIHALLNGSAGGGSDYGLDTNGNGKFDWLVVNADVNLPSAGTWWISAVLSSSSPPVGGSCGSWGQPVPMMGLATFGPMPAQSAWPIVWAYESYFFEAGAQTVRFAFNGTEISRAGVAGPYAVDLSMVPGGSPIVYGGIASSDPSTMPIRAPDAVVTWTYTTKAYAATDFETPVRPAFFSGGHTDLGVDADADGLFDYLEIRADVHANLAGTYYLNGALTAGTGSNGPVLWLGYASRSVDLVAGDQTVSLRFRGDTIAAAGVNGPYSFSITLSGPSPPPYVDNGTRLLVPNEPGIAGPMPAYYVPESLCGATGPYATSDFDNQSELVAYTGVFDEKPLDWDGNGLYDALTIRAQVDVFVSAAFDVQGVLTSSDGSRFVASLNVTAWMPQGLGWVDFTFPGYQIRASGIDGPYLATLSLTPGARGLDPVTTYRTAAYLASQFDGNDFKCWNCTVVP